MPLAQIELRTARLVLRSIGRDDARLLHDLWTTAGVRRFLWDGEVIPIARTEAVIHQSERLFAERQCGLWGAWTIDDRQLAGFGGLWPFRDPPALELLYGVAESQWGRGYATEIARAVIDYCFDVLGIAVVRASTDVGNTASVRVLDKIGFQFVGQHAVGGLDTAFYDLPQCSASLDGVYV